MKRDEQHGRATVRWMGICAAAAVLLALVSGVLIRTRRPLRAHVMPVEVERCALPAVVPVPALQHAEDPPMLLWAEGDVRLFVDGQAAFSSPEAPRRYAPGIHTLRLEGADGQPWTFRFRVHPFTPVLLHAATHPNLGTTLVYLGATCEGCTTSGSESAEGLAEAAEALRRADVSAAAGALKNISPSERNTPGHRRVSAAVLAATGQPAKARAELSALAARNPDLRGLLAALDALDRREQLRRPQVTLTRWNKVTETFGGLLIRFEHEAPGSAAVASARLEQLSAAFQSAHKAPPSERESLLAAAETALMTYVAQLRNAHPNDCAFQALVMGAILN